MSTRHYFIANRIGSYGFRKAVQLMLGKEVSASVAGGSILIRETNPGDRRTGCPAVEFRTHWPKSIGERSYAAC